MYIYIYKHVIWFDLPMITIYIYDGSGKISSEKTSFPD